MINHHLLLLHGALGVRTQFDALLPMLKNQFNTHTLDMEGHGKSPPKDRPLRIEHIVENILEYLDDQGLAAVGVFGHSLGGQIGLHLAAYYPDRVTGLFTLGTKFKWSPEIAEQENKFLMPEKIVKKVPAYAAELRQRHTASGWETLLEKIREMHVHIGGYDFFPDDNLRKIETKVRIALGDRDNMTSLEESQRVYRLLPKGELQVFPNTAHPLEKVSTIVLSQALIDFFKSV